MTALPGFANQGDTCYVDVILYLLLVPFAKFTRRRILDAPPPVPRVPGCDAVAVVAVLRDAKESIFNAEAVTCQNFRDAINRCTPPGEALQNVPDDPHKVLAILFGVFNINILQLLEPVTGEQTGTVTEPPVLRVDPDQVTDIRTLETGIREDTLGSDGELLASTLLTYLPTTEQPLLVVHVDRMKAAGKVLQEMDVPETLFDHDLRAVVVHIDRPSHYVAFFKYPDPQQACVDTWYLYNDLGPRVDRVGGLDAVLTHPLQPRKNGTLFFYWGGSYPPWEDIQDTYTDAAAPPAHNRPDTSMGAAATAPRPGTTSMAPTAPTTPTRKAGAQPDVTSMGAAATAPTRKTGARPDTTVGAPGSVPAVPQTRPSTSATVQWSASLTAAELAARANILWNLYVEPAGLGYPPHSSAFPKNAIGYLYGTRRPNIERLGRRVRVYAPKDAPGAEVVNLVLQREPANVAMVEYFRANELQAALGWRKSYYRQYYDTTGRLAPNIGVYCRTPVYTRSAINQTNFEQVAFPRGAPMVHVYNMIGLAFDSREQPDYRFHAAMDERARKAAVTNMYTNAFVRVFQCALDRKLTTIVFSAVGTNNFALEYPDMARPDFIFMPALLRARQRVGYRHSMTFMGVRGQPAWVDVVREYGDVGLFPDNLRRVDQDTTLLVNAWDPHSIVGNANAVDNSLDGFMGRITAMGLLCWPATNPHLKIRRVAEV